MTLDGKISSMKIYVNETAQLDKHENNVMPLECKGHCTSYRTVAM